MQFPDLSSLPPWAVVAFGVSLAIIFAFVWLGVNQGRRTSSVSSASSAQVAAVIVDPSALNRATAAVEALTKELAESNKVGRRMATSNASLAKRVTDFGAALVKSNELLATGLDEIREEMRLDREVNRR